MEPISFLDGISGFVRASTNGAADKGIRLAVVDPGYDAFSGLYPDAANPARVTFEGETTLSGKAYAVAAGFIPSPGARVWMVPIGNSWLISGGVGNYTAQGFYALPDGSYSGVEFGDGSYFDTDNGLVLLTDAEIAGDLSVGGIGKTIDVVKPSNTQKVNATMAADPHLTTPLEAGTWFVEFDVIWGATVGDIKTRWDITGTTATYSLKTCQGPSPFTVDTATPDESQGRDATPIRFSVHQYTTEVTYGANSNTLYYGLREWGIVRLTTAGAITLTWAQETTDAAFTVVVGGSMLRAKRIA